MQSHDDGARPILQIKDLAVQFFDHAGRAPVHAVRNVSFDVHAGRTVCVVGESGSGKSVTARTILGLIEAPGEVTNGQILFETEADSDPIDLAQMGAKDRQMRAIRGNDIAMIFQEPMTSLSPVHTIGSQIIEAIMLHQKVNRSQARQQTIELLKSVEIPNPDTAIDKYTFEYSGGMRQRAMIAMALSCSPKILIADEPTTALDVTTQAEILALIKRMQKQYSMAVIFITHDMGVVAEIADDVVVMRGGDVLENGPVHQIFDTAQHAYTRELIDSVRRLEQSARIARGAEIGTRPILSVGNLTKQYGVTQSLLGKRKSAGVAAVSDVSFDLFEGENLGIVGESGSGKTTLGNCLMRIVEPTDGRIEFSQVDGIKLDVAKARHRDLKSYYREARMVFQDPFASLNPRMTIGNIIAEPMKVNKIVKTSGDRRARAAELLNLVGLPADVIDRYPHAFSGGQRQRIGIARALALNPRLVVADEATSALDVTLRSQILDLLLDLQEKLGLSYILISHDLGVIRYFCDRVAVMYKGKLVEIGAAEKICTEPDHPYTRALLSAAPGVHPDMRRIANRHRYNEQPEP